MDLRNEAYGAPPSEGIADPLYVLCGHAQGYVAFYNDYPAEVAAGRRPRG